MLSDGEVEAGLFSFIFYVAESLSAEVVEHFGHNLLHLQVVAQEGRVGIVVTNEGNEAVVGNINSGAVAMAGVGSGVAVALLQP